MNGFRALDYERGPARTYSIQFILAIAICFEMLMLMMILLFVYKAIQFDEYYNVFPSSRTVAQTECVCVFVRSKMNCVRRTLVVSTRIQQIF